MVKQPRGSAHKIEIAQRFHADRGRVPRFAYFWREKVSAWELSDDSCSASVRTQIVGKTKFFDSLKKEAPVQMYRCLLAFAVWEERISPRSPRRPRAEHE